MAPASVIEAAVVANRLRRKQRLDLSCFVALALLRAAAHGAHGREPLTAADWVSGEQASGLFVAYASELFDRCDDSLLDPLELIHAHDEFGFFVTYPSRCVRLMEIIGLLGLWRRLSGHDDEAVVVNFVEKFIASHSGASHPVSDRFAVSLIAPALLVGSSGNDTAKWLRDTAHWVIERYDGESLGLGAIEASPEEEVAYVLSAFDHIDVQRRRESYLAAVILDLASVLELDTLYSDARNDFEAVDALPEILHLPDTPAQYRVDGLGIEHEINPPYAEDWPEDGTWRTAHHHGDDAPLWLERNGRAWHELAIWSVNRDRHSVGLMRRLVEDDPPK